MQHVRARSKPANVVLRAARLAAAFTSHMGMNIWLGHAAASQLQLLVSLDFPNSSLLHPPQLFVLPEEEVNLPMNGEQPHRRTEWDRSLSERCMCAGRT